MQKPEVHVYLNYRKFLKDVFQYYKKSDPQFSQKWVLGQLGLNSSGFISNIFAGRKNLTPGQITKMVRLIKLGKGEADYFENLVYFTQAKTIEEKNDFFSRLVTLQSASLRILPVNQLSLFAKWYYVYIREMLEFVPFKGNYSEYGKLLDPAITAKQVKEAMDALLKMNLILKDTNGRLVPVDNAISTGNELKSMHLAKFQMITMDLAKRAIEKINPSERDISVLSFSASPDNFHLIKNEIQHFRKRLAKLAVDDVSQNRLYQMNLQFFPVSREYPK